MARRTRRKRDGTTEQIGTCPLCGSLRNYEVNLDTGLYSCWACGYSGRVGPGTNQPAVLKQQDPNPPKAQDKFPDYALRAMSDRGFDPDFLRWRYHIFWDGERVCWPSGPDGRCARRSVFSWEQPKVLSYGERGIIGYHLMEPGSTLVLTEGDYKAASIPIPFVGLGIQGTGMTPSQVQMVTASRPRLILVILDVGKDVQARVVAQNFWMYRTRVVTMPPLGNGPDDLPKDVLVSLLLAAADGEKTIARTI